MRAVYILAIFAVLAVFFVPHAKNFGKYRKMNELKPIALVKVGDTIYHCEKIREYNCGLALTCGNINFHCANNVTIEWLKQE